MLGTAFWPMIALGADGTDEQEGKDATPAGSFDFSVESVGRASIDGTDASLAYTEYSAGMSWQFLLLDIDHRKSTWRPGTGFGGGGGGGFGQEPWDELTRVAPGLQYYSEVGDRWALWLQMIAIAGFEDNLSSRSWTYNPQVVALYTLREDLNLFAGMGTLYHPVDSTPYPVLGVAWNMNAKAGFSGTLGVPETTLRYHFNERLAVKADVQRDIRMYRLSDGNPIAPSGYFHTDELTSGIHLEYVPVESLQMTVGVRRFMDRSMTVFSKEESTLADHKVNDAWTIRFAMEYGF